MRYKNLKTGAIIDSSYRITGENWVNAEKLPDEQLAPTAAVVEEQSATEEVEQPEGNTSDFDGITIAQIKQELDAFGVEYNPKEKKQVLYDLMMSQGK